MPLYFITNQGQLDSRVAYYVQGSDESPHFTPADFTFGLSDLTPQPPSLQGKWEYNSPSRFGEGLGERSGRWISKLDFMDAIR